MVSAPKFDEDPMKNYGVTDKTFIGKITSGTHFLYSDTGFTNVPRPLTTPT